MALSSYRMHRIYIAATMKFGLGSNDPQELIFYNKISEELDEMKKDAVKKGIPLRWETPDGINKWFKIIFYLLEGIWLL